MYSCDLLEANVCERAFYCPHYTAADVSPPVQSHHRITCRMSPHQSRITAVNVIKEMLDVDSRQDSSCKMELCVCGIVCLCVLR